MVVPAKFNYIGSSCDSCISTDNIMIATGKTDAVKAYGPSGMCGSIANLPDFRSRPGITFIEKNRLIVYGGWNSGLGKNDVWEYEKSSSTWKTLSSMMSGSGNYGGAYGNAQVLSNQWNAFYFGGAPCSVAGCSQRVSTYNGNLDQWSTANNFPRDARGGCTVTLGRFVLVIAYSSEKKETLVELYDSATGNFESLNALSYQVFSPQCSLVKLGDETGVIVFGKDYAGNMNLQYLKLNNLRSGPWVVLCSSGIGCNLLQNASQDVAMIAMIGGNITLVAKDDAIMLNQLAKASATNNGFIGIWKVAPANTFDYIGLSSFTQIPRSWLPGC